MKLENEFTVAAPIEKTWETLMDIERVAACLPGATIEPGGDGGMYRGKMRVKLGPVTVDYRGTARFQDVDEDDHVASISVQAKEAKGQGTAAATITNRLAETPGGGTSVTAVTDLKITGRQAQFGRGIMEDVASSMMTQFAERLEKEILNGSRREEPDSVRGGLGSVIDAATQSDPSPASGSGPVVDDDQDDVLDVGGLLAGMPLARYAMPVGVCVLVLLTIALMAAASGRSRSRYTLNVNLRR